MGGGLDGCESLTLRIQMVTRRRDCSPEDLGFRLDLVGLLPDVWVVHRLARWRHQRQVIAPRRDRDPEHLWAICRVCVSLPLTVVGTCVIRRDGRIDAG